MSCITAIVSHAKNPQRASVRVDGKTVASLSWALVRELRLAVDTPWDDALARRVAAAAAYDKALRAAMRRIDRRALSSRQLQRKLEQLQFEPAVVRRVVDRLTELGALNDRTFGEALIRELQRRAPAGPHLLRSKLRHAGLDARLTEQLLSESDGSDDQVERAGELIHKKLRSMQGVGPAARKRRLWAMLSRRGFEPETIERAMMRLGQWEEP